MKFVVDAQLPRRLAHELAASGHDVTHTLDFPLGNRTPDGEIAALALREGRVVVTKDSDSCLTLVAARTNGGNCLKGQDRRGWETKSGKQESGNK
jgi:predicted nuclease of predicted toxin-antitoxin system